MLDRDAPRRVQLSRAKNWRMPANSIKVDRSTPWGNPFVVGKHGTRAECVELYRKLLLGLVAIGMDNYDEQRKAIAHVRSHREDLRGANLACWCSLDGPCHADLLLRHVNGDVGL